MPGPVQEVRQEGWPRWNKRLALDLSGATTHPWVINDETAQSGPGKLSQDVAADAGSRAG
jgi:hypothetical protein